MTDNGQHLSPAALLDYARGLLGTADAATAETHLAECARCATEVTATRRVFQLARADELEDAPAHVVNRAIRLFRQSRAAPSASVRERLLSWLRFDSAQAPLASGVRSGLAVPRHLVYAASTYTVEMRVMTRGSEYSLAGQVLGPCEGGQVTVTGPHGQTEAELSPLCEFDVGLLPGGTYQMTVRLADVEIEIPNLELD